jgi:hypothetical protein
MFHVNVTSQRQSAVTHEEMKRKPQRPKTKVTPNREARDWSRITQTRISEHFELSREYVNRIITGAYHNPVMLKKIRDLVSGWLREDKTASQKLLSNLYGGDR